MSGPVASSAAPFGAGLDAFLDAHLEELIAFRRELHAHPELSDEEHETTARVARTAPGRRARAARPAHRDRAHLRPPGPRPTGPAGRAAGRPRRARDGRRDDRAVPIAGAGRRARVRPRRAHDRRPRRRARPDPAPRLGGCAPTARCDCSSSRPRSPRPVARSTSSTRAGSPTSGWLFGLHCDPKLDAGQIGVRVGRDHLRGGPRRDPAARPGRPHRPAPPHRRPRRRRRPARRGPSRGAARGSIRRSTSCSARSTRATRPTSSPRPRRCAGRCARPIAPRGTRAPDRLDAALHAFVEPTGATFEIDHDRGVPPVVNDERATELLAGAAAVSLGCGRGRADRAERGRRRLRLVRGAGARAPTPGSACTTRRRPSRAATSTRAPSTSTSARSPIGVRVLVGATLAALTAPDRVHRDPSTARPSRPELVRCELVPPGGSRVAPTKRRTGRRGSGRVRVDGNTRESGAPG